MISPFTRIAADRGDPVAQHQLGCFFERGSTGSNHDYLQAHEWYLKSANSGYPPAQYSMGMLYLSGYGVAPDPEIGQHGFLKARSRDMHFRSLSWLAVVKKVMGYHQIQNVR